MNWTKFLSMESKWNSVNVLQHLRALTSDDDKQQEIWRARAHSHALKTQFQSLCILWQQNVTPNVTSRFPFSSSLPSSSCWWRYTDFAYHFHTVYEIRFLLFISFEISLLPVSFGRVYIVFFLLLLFALFRGGASTSTVGLRRQPFFGIAITNTDIGSYEYEYKTCFSCLNFPENYYYCFCLCRKIRPKLETIAFLPFGPLLDIVRPRSEHDETRKRRQILVKIEMKENIRLAGAGVAAAMLNLYYIW